MREAVADLFSSSVGHVVVDEVFDANPLDLALVILACDAGIAVTLIGDPSQALYGFRGARPDLVPGGGRVGCLPGPGHPGRSAPMPRRRRVGGPTVVAALVGLCGLVGCSDSHGDARATWRP